MNAAGAIENRISVALDLSRIWKITCRVFDIFVSYYFQFTVHLRCLIWQLKLLSRSANHYDTVICKWLRDRESRIIISSFLESHNGSHTSDTTQCINFKLWLCASAIDIDCGKGVCDAFLWIVTMHSFLIAIYIIIKPISFLYHWRSIWRTTCVYGFKEYKIQILCFWTYYNPFQTFTLFHFDSI